MITSALRWLLLLFAAMGGVLVLVWCVRKRSLLVQFLILLAMGVLMSFLLLMIVQLPEYRSWLATLLVLMVFLASPIAVRLFLQSLSTDESERANKVHKSP
jgi:DMSO reductase anchor subunit